MRIFNEMQPSKVTKLVRLFSRYFSISFFFLVLWLSFRLEKNRDLYGYFHHQHYITRGVEGAFGWRPAKNSWRRPRKNFHFNKSLVKIERRKSGSQTCWKFNSWNVVHGPPSASSPSSFNRNNNLKQKKNAFILLTRPFFPTFLLLPRRVKSWRGKFENEIRFASCDFGVTTLDLTGH